MRPPGQADRDGEYSERLLPNAKRSTLDSFAPLERQTTASLIADRIREAIMDGTVPPGSQLVEAELASRLRVSRGPVREATQRLIQEGLLTSERFRGVFVTKLRGTDIDDLYTARRAVERAAIEIFIEERGERKLESLQSLVDEMRVAAAAKQWEEVAALDLKFHKTLVDASDSPRLTRMFATLLVETKVCMTALEGAYPRPTELVAEHKALLQAMAQRDLDRALVLIDEHLASAARHLVEVTKASD